MLAVYRLRLALVALIALCLFQQADGQSASRLIKEGDEYFKHGMFRPALQYYRQAGNPQTWQGDVKLRVAISLFEINEIDGAIPLLVELVRAGKTDPMVFLYLGKSYHHKNQFSHAVTYYKQFLRKSRNATPLRDWVKDEVVRCANGISMRYGQERAYVENMGAAVNSFGDDYAPVPSPNYQERLYFTSAREDSEGGMQAYGATDPKFGSYRSDIYYVEQDNGIWRSAIPLDHILNSNQNEEIFCFSADGQQMYYHRGQFDTNGELLVDTFSIASRANATNLQLGPFEPGKGDRDLFVFNDTIMLFASQRAGGYGSYDVYYSVKRRGRWRDAVNLGPVINSFYDDRSPYLSRNGRLLFLSSNRLESIGGLDVFIAHFIDSTGRWSPLENIGIPINSAGDETDFWLAGDGLKAYLSSNRKTGYGERDIYAAYFKEQVLEQLSLSNPTSFIQIDIEKENREEEPLANPVQPIREYLVSDLLFDPNDVVITPQNLKKIEVLSNMMLIYPMLKLDLICHDVPSGPKSYDLFFSVKKAEQVAQQLIRKGVAADRIYVKGCGAYYPAATGSDQASVNPGSDRLNRRIEVYVYNAEDQPVALIMEQPIIPEGLRDPRGVKFDSLQHQLVYRVQVAQVGQLFQHSVFDEYADAMVELDTRTRMYRYLIGMETLYKNAAVLRDALRRQGFDDAFVVPYFEGRRITLQEVPQYTDRFPDLLNFVE